MTVRFTPAGRRQFLNTIAYIKNDRPTAAQRFRRAAESKLRRLERFPDSGRTIPEFPDLPFRELIIRPYRFFHRREGETTWIVAAWHGAQLLERSGEGAASDTEGRERVRIRRQALLAHLHVARYLAAHAEALAQVIESVGPDALPTLGRALARRVEAVLEEQGA